MSLKISLAYDGSINADWVARYALNMALHAGCPLRLIHIEDGTYSRESIAAKITAVAEEARILGVEFHQLILPLVKDVTSSLLSAIPPGPGSLCVCGVRLTSRGKGFLAGTISESLLRPKLFDAMAIRVVKPGLLGAPRDLLFPLSGHPQGFKAAMEFFRLLAPEVDCLHLLRVMEVSSFWFQYMSVTKSRALHLKGMNYLNGILADIRQQLSDTTLHIDGKVILSDDWVKAILIQASKLKTQMIIMGTSDRNLPSRYFYGNKIEQILRETPCDVGIYRKI
jgi:nucleotide-binding universal stress UspA family protein